MQSWESFSEPANLFLSPASVEAPSFRLAGAKVGGSFYFARGMGEIFCGDGRKGVWLRVLGGGLICVKYWRIGSLREKGGLGGEKLVDFRMEDWRVRKAFLLYV